MARFFFATFWTVVFTGAVRKWLFPGVSAFYLLQDVPIGLAYAYALWAGLLARGLMLLTVILFVAIVTLQALIQMIVPELSPVVALVGLHHYLFYIPMLLIFPVCLTAKYRQAFIRWNLWLSIPMCLLAIAQNAAPKSAFINRTSEGEAFGVSGAEVARVMGTFNFTGFYGMWVAMAVALCLGEWLLPLDRRVISNRWILIACTIAVNLCHLVSASRSAIFLAGLALAGAIFAAALMRSGRALLAMAGVCVLLPLAAGATYILSPEEFNIVYQRFTGSDYQSENKVRATRALTGFVTDPRLDLIGAGIGMGIDAAHAGSANAYTYTYDLAEQDLTRNVMELGTPVGLLYALVRLGFGFGMLFLAIRMVRAGLSPHVLPLGVLLLAEVYIGDMTRNATMTTTQVMIGYSFMLGVYFNQDQASPELTAGELRTRSA